MFTMKNMLFQLHFLLIIILLHNLRYIFARASLEIDISTGHVRCLDRERRALLKFKDDLVDEYGRLSSWGTKEKERDCCQWVGVRCHNTTNHVIRLDLRGQSDYLGFRNAPTGTLGSSLLELQHLSYLDLSYNDFGLARFPQFIGSFTELRYLSLSFSSLEGPIPHHYGNLSKLSYLDLSYNNLYLEPGENIDWVSSLYSLKYLVLSFMNLSMTTNWLQVISNLASIKELHLPYCKLPPVLSLLPSSTNVSNSLTILDLSWNYLPTSTISWFLNSDNRLTYISVAGNYLKDPILVAFVNMTSLAYLDLSSSLLDGGIPKSFGNMTSLIHLDLRDNNLTSQLSELMTTLSGPLQHRLQYLDLGGNNISGSFPDISRFSSLMELRLWMNKMDGLIPGAFLQLPHLLVLDLSKNQFTGSVPDLSLSSPSLRELYLNKNMFGTLTKAIGALSQLEVLSVGPNHLEGTITEADFIHLSKLQVLDLSSNSLLNVNMNSDWIPPFQLNYMNLANCKLEPRFPKWVSTQKQLSFLDMSVANISDTISNWFGSFSRTLVYLNLSSNQLYGSFPNISFSTSNFSPANYLLSGDLALDLSRNKLSGSINFLCHFTSWKTLDLSDNLLSGQLPDCFANFKNLEYLNLANNHFSGEIPYSFGFLSSLSWLHLWNNSFSGRIPTSMRNCTRLHVIDLGENRLTGTFPKWIGDNLSDMVILSLRNNRFYGSIPLSICHLSYLQVLDLSLNRISGAIPECLHNLTAMTKEEKSNLYFLGYYTSAPFLPYRFYRMNDASRKSEIAFMMWKGKVECIHNLQFVKLIDLASNNLSGEIPSNITALVGLVGLNFSRNNLSGPIPEDIGHLTVLNFLDFSRNNLSGGIPTNLCELSHLGALDLSQNTLSGQIPQCTQLLTFNESTYRKNLGLCGHPLNNSCSEGGNATNRPPKPEAGQFITEEFYIAMGLGFLVGFWGILGTMLLSTSFRYALFKAWNKVEDCLYVWVEVRKARLRRHFENK